MLRPMRPNPLMPTRIAMMSLVSFDRSAEYTALRPFLDALLHCLPRGVFRLQPPLRHRLPVRAAVLSLEGPRQRQVPADLPRTHGGVADRGHDVRSAVDLDPCGFGRRGAGRESPDRGAPGATAAAPAVPL